MHAHREPGQIFDRGDLISADQGPGWSLGRHDVDDGGTFLNCQKSDVDTNVGRDLRLTLRQSLNSDRPVFDVLLVHLDSLLGEDVPGRGGDESDEVGAAPMDCGQSDRFHRFGRGGLPGRCCCVAC